MLSIANKKLFKYVPNLLRKQLSITFSRVSSSSIQTNKLNKLLKRNFCSSDNPETKQTPIKLSHQIAGKDLKLSKLSLNILKYLERNFELYEQLCEDSIKLSYDLSESSDGNEYLKNELMRINRQISTFSKDNYFFEEIKNLIKHIDSNIELIKEAEEINDEEIKLSAINEIKECRKKMDELQDEIVEYLIPDEFVN
jgi:hypothetical protein